MNVTIYNKIQNLKLTKNSFSSDKNNDKALYSSSTEINI